MDKYKRYIYFLGVFISIFILLFLCVHFLGKGYTHKYTVNNNFKVTEIYTKGEEKEHDNYYLEIKANDKIYNYEFYYLFNDNNKLVKDVLFYDGAYQCLLPVLSDNIKVDFLCYDNQSSLYNYHDILGLDEELDEYISSIDKNIYDVELFKDTTGDVKTHEKINYYSSNIPNNYVIALTTFKGIITIINDQVNVVDLFDTDIYRRDLSLFTNNYYVTANYMDINNFREFYIVDILNGKVQNIKAPDYLSFNSYIQGSVDDCVYIYDIDHSIQYKIDIKKGLISIVGNANKGIRYYDGKWSSISTIKAQNRLLFKTTSEEFNYDYFYKDGHKISGFYYFFEKQGDQYDVYRASVQKANLKKYLFSVNDFHNVVFEEDYVFYKDGNAIKMYSDYTGIKTLVMMQELEFNNNILFNVYKK